MARFDVDPATFEIVNRLLDQALDRPPEEREKWNAALPLEHEALKPR